MSTCTPLPAPLDLHEIIGFDRPVVAVFGNSVIKRADILFVPFTTHVITQYVPLQEVFLLHVDWLAFRYAFQSLAAQRQQQF